MLNITSEGILGYDLVQADAMKTELEYHYEKFSENDLKGFASVSLGRVVVPNPQFKDDITRYAVLYFRITHIEYFHQICTQTSLIPLSALSKSIMVQYEIRLKNRMIFLFLHIVKYD